jgi:hypothetical protein
MRSQPNDHPIHATPQQGGAFVASRRSRRGSTIIVAVGVLAVLALVAVSYAVAVRSDRVSVASYQRSADLDSSARVVRDEIGAILAADLFGNKIVTPDIPYEGTLGGSTIRVWPRMFEDGEFFDAPRTAPGTFDTRNPINQRNVPSPNAPYVVAPDTTSIVGPFFPSAPERDDAWLSNTEPYNRFAPSPRDGVLSFDWTTWGQFSNMLSAYRWVRNGLNDNVGLWVRDDGRYADLGMFFLTDFARDPNRLRGDPGADLAYLDESDPTSIDEFTGQVNGPLVGLRETPAIGVSPVTFATDVLQLQIHELGEILVGNPAMPEFNAFDERFFADTDGDLRADARWQSLDTLDGLLGLRWVVATRIIDNSALVNVNTAMEFQGSDPATQTLVGDGRTPADVDLTRLVRSAHLMPDLRTVSPWEPGASDVSVLLEIWSPTSGNSLYSNSRGIYGPTVDPNTVNPINEHLITQLGLDGLTLAASEDQLAPVELVWSAESSVTAANAVEAGSGDVILGSPPGTNPAPPFTTRLHRYLTNRFFGVSPLQPTVDQARPYPMTDEAELRAFFGVNSGGLISNVEQRFDHQRLDDSFGLFAGPLRATEGIVPTGFPARNLALNPTAAGEARPSLAAIAGDTRRLLTTVSGSADFSPVPVLNDLTVGTGSNTRVFDRPFNAKVRFRDVPRISPQNADAIANQDKFAAEMRAKRAVVSDAFSAFAWALAPLAGHTPLMSPLGVEHTGPRLAATSLNEFAKYAYGGDRDTSRGPAFVLGGLMQASGLSQADAQPGAAYAMLRALSLAVNLADATDDERLVPQNAGNSPLPPEQRLAPSGATLDLPTVARLYNIVHPTPNDMRDDPGEQPFPGLPPVTTTGDQVIRVGVAFPWGDLRDPAAPIPGGQPVPTANAQLMPVGHVGEPTNGVTLVGLDRQPFLRQVYTIAVYADRRALDRLPPASAPYDEQIDPDREDERIGSIVAWEVGNPWAESIDIAGVRLALALNNALVQINPVDTDASRGTAIGAGEHVVFYALQWRNGDTEAETFMRDYATNWVASFAMRLPNGDEDVRFVPGTSDDRGLTDASGTVSNEGIPLHAWSDGSAVGLIYLPDTTVAGAGTLVLDRLSNDLSQPGVPARLNTVLELDESNQATNRWTGYTTIIGYARRNTEGAPGFPAWVIERPSANVSDRTTDDQLLVSWGFTNSGGFVTDPPEIPGSQGGVEADASGVGSLLGEEDKGLFPLPTGSLPSFQLFVPNTELRYTSELLQLSAFTHMYVHAALDGAGATLGANIALSTRFGPGTWRTVSEQLGSDAELYRDTTVGGTGTVVNPYLGVLDPTRFVLAAQNAPGATQLGVLGPVQNVGFNKGLPEALAIPLALRVVDCFEALWTPDWRGGNRLVQGRVNINTATQKTLRMLPLVDPAAAIGPLSPQGANAGDDWRVPMIMAYRDRLGNAQIPFTPREITGLLGTNLTPLRFVDPSVEFGSFVSGVDYSRGFVTPGELVTLGRWRLGPDAGSPDPAVYNGRSFLELGANGANDSANDTAVPSIDVRRETYSPSDIQVRPTPLTGGSLDAYEGVDDPEERLALYRAVSNIVTARSDVYSAYFTVRGYAPGDIEAVDEIDTNPSDIQIAEYMERLTPRFEARYLAVYDRSNVRTPVDRPRVLLFVRLPD